MSGGGKTSTSSSQVSIPPEVLARYNAVNAQAQQVAQQPFHAYSQDPNAFVAPLSPTQQAGIYNTNVAAGAAQPYYQQAGRALQAGLGIAAPMAYQGAQAVNPGQLGAEQIGQYMSPYLGSVVGTTMAAQAQQNAQQRAAMQGQAIQAGAFGGDRAGIAQANLGYQQKLADAQTISNLMNQGYGQALQTAGQQQQLGLSAEQANRAALQQQAQNLYGMYGGYGQALAGLGTGAQQAGLQGAQAQLAAGQMQQQTGQAGLAAMYNQFQQQQSYPFQVAQFLANIAMGTGALSGSSTTATQPASFFSDRRLKHDIHRIGATHDGQPIYAFKYKGDDRTQIGLLAQEVEKKHPEAVGLAAGFKTVDYEKATEDARKAYGGGLSSMGGAVGPQQAGLGYARGGYLGGGLVDPTDMRAILAKMQEQYSNLPFAQSGFNVRGQPGGGAKGHVPSGGLHIPALATAKIATQKQPTAMQEMREVANTVDDLEKFYKQGRTAYNWAFGDEPKDKAAAASRQASSAAPPPVPASAPAAVAPAAPAEIKVGSYQGGLEPETNVASLDEPWDFSSLFAARGGLIRARRQDGGESVQDLYETEDGLNIPGQDNIPKSLTPPPAPSGGGGGGGSEFGLMDAAKLGISIAGLFSDRRLKENIHDIGKTFDGQTVYSYNFKGDPRTQMGLIAQEVARHNPDAVGSHRGYKTVDYDTATRGAAARGHFYAGGLAPRHGYQTDGAVAELTPQEEFRARYAPYAQRVSEETGIHPNVVLAQAALETGWGRSAPGHNFFGIKGPGQTLATTEVVEGKPVAVRDSFRRYESPEESFTDYGKFLRENPRYQGVLAARGVQDQIAAMGRSGYATDPEYGAKLLRIAGQLETGKEVADVQRRVAGLSPAREVPAPRQEGLARTDAGEPSRGGGLGAMQGVVREAREPSFSERNREWMLPVVRGIGSMLASPSLRLPGAIGHGLVGAVQGIEKAQELEQAQQARDVGMLAQNVSAKRLEADYQAMQHALAAAAYDAKTAQYLVYINGVLTRMNASDYNRRRREHGLESVPLLPPSVFGQEERAPRVGGPSPAAIPGAPSAPAAVTPPGASVPPGAAGQLPIYQKLPEEVQATLPDIQRRLEDTPQIRDKTPTEAQNPFPQLFANQSASQSQGINRLTLVNELAALPPGATGPLAQKFLMPAAEYVNGTLRALGIGAQIAPEALASSEQINKIVTEIASKYQQQAGGRAFQELQAFMSAIPTAMNSPAGAAKVSAGLMANAQRHVDMGNFAKLWQDGMRNNGADEILVKFSGENLQNEFSRRAPAYQREEKALEEIFGTDVNIKDPRTGAVSTRPLVTILSGKTGDIPAAIKDRVVARYGPHILRYFQGQ